VNQSDLDFRSSTAGDGFFGTLVARPVGLFVVFMTLVVVGVIAYQRIPVQLLPSEFTSTNLFLWIPNPGASAQENEEQVAREIEEQFRTLTGIEKVTSQSSDDLVFMQVEFNGRVDLDLAKAELRDRLERARPFLPDTVENIGLWSESASSIPIAVFGITHPEDTERTDYLIEKVVKPRLEAVQGVGKLDIWGVLQDSVRILLDEDKVAAARVDIGAIISRLSSDNFALPLGEINDGGRELILRSDMRFTTLEEIGEYPIGGGLRLKDVGEIRKVKSVADQLSRIDGQYAYYGMVVKDSQSNVVEVTQAFREAADALSESPEVNGELRFQYFFMQGDLIESSLAQLRKTAIEGGLLALVVLIVFLRRVRMTICVALSIPVSALLAIAWEQFSGGSFNILTMTGVTLGIGMLVDNAVVVVENIVRVHQEGESGTRAAVRGVRQIAMAVTLATLTTVVVFLPLIFMTSDPMLRVLFGGIGIPLSLSLLASLFVAVVFQPVIVGRLLGDRPRPMQLFAAGTGRIMALPGRAVARVVGLARLVFHYLLVATHAANRVTLSLLTPLRLVVALVALGAGALAWMFVQESMIGGTALEEFGVGFGLEELRKSSGFLLGAAIAIVVLLALLALPHWRRRAAAAPTRPARFTPAGSSLLDLLISSNRVLVGWTLKHRLLAGLASTGAFLTILVPMSLGNVTAFAQDGGRDSIGFEVAFDTDFRLSEAAEELLVYEEFFDEKKAEYGFDHWSSRFDARNADMEIHFESPPGKEELERLERQLREEVPRLPGHRLSFYDEERTGSRSAKVAFFRLRGPDSQRLNEIGAEAVALLKDVPGLSEIKSPLDTSPEQVQVTIDRELALGLGVDTQMVQNTIRYVLAGWALPRFQEGGRDVPFLIEFDAQNVAGLPTLRDMNVFTPGGSVPISSIADMSFGREARSIRRENGQTTFTVSARVDDPLRITEITESGYTALERIEMPRGFSVDRGDSALQRQEMELSEALKAFALSIVLVFLLMGILFESVLLPFSVLFTIPFAVLGAFWTLFLSGHSIDFLGMVGMIILAGVVVNNGIVLIDRIHRLRGEGTPRDVAVIQGCGQRVRPIMMTALTTVSGLLPMILSAPPRDGIDYRVLATIIAGGLIASTFFTLWVVPLMYTLLDDVSEVMRTRFRWWLRPVGVGSRRIGGLAGPDA
jgi:multidrug efflux pump subunit AcrB